jgi:site-specific recombinase XerC
MDAEVLMANPAARLKLPSGTPTVERYLEHEEFDAIAEHLEGEWLAMAELLVNTGQRFGEAAGLHWHRVNPAQQMARIVEAWSPAAGAIKLYTKGKRRGQVPWLDWVDLNDEPRWTTCGVKHPGCRSGLVVPSRAGTPIDGANFRKRFDAACKAAGVGHVRPHDLRHTYASWLLQDGTTLAEVGKLLGHTSSATTERYAHLQEKPSEAAVNALRRARRAAASRYGRLYGATAPPPPGRQIVVLTCTNAASDSNRLHPAPPCGSPSYSAGCGFDPHGAHKVRARRDHRRARSACTIECSRTRSDTERWFSSSTLRRGLSSHAAGSCHGTVAGVPGCRTNTCWWKCGTLKPTMALKTWSVPNWSASTRAAAQLTRAIAAVCTASRCCHRSTCSRLSTKR